MPDKVVITITDDYNGVKYENHIDIYPVKEDSLDKDKLWEYFEILRNRIETEKKLNN